jgi:hypothetical protein
MMLQNAAARSAISRSSVQIDSPRGCLRWRNLDGLRQRHPKGVTDPAVTVLPAAFFVFKLSALVAGAHP